MNTIWFLYAAYGLSLLHRSLCSSYTAHLTVLGNVVWPLILHTLLPQLSFPTLPSSAMSFPLRAQHNMSGDWRPANLWLPQSWDGFLPLGSNRLCTFCNNNMWRAFVCFFPSDSQLWLHFGLGPSHYNFIVSSEAHRYSFKALHNFNVHPEFRNTTPDC